MCYSLQALSGGIGEADQCRPEELADLYSGQKIPNRAVFNDQE
jgi:hypothetical protein